MKTLGGVTGTNKAIDLSRLRDSGRSEKETQEA